MSTELRPQAPDQSGDTIFPWRGLLAFFAALVLVGWLLYPNQYFRGLMYSQDADRKTSVAYFQDFLAKNPHHRGATRALMQVYEDAGDPESAIAVMTELYRHRKGDAMIEQELLDLLDRAGKLDAAQSFRWQLYQDLRGKPEVDRDSQEGLLDDFHDRAVLLQDPKGEALALAELMRTVKDGDSYRSDLVSQELVQGQFQQALLLAQAGLRQKSQDPDTWLRLANVQLAMGDPSQALDTLRQGMEQVPRSRDLLDKRVAVLESLGRFADALPDLRRLVALEPGSADRRRTLAYDTLRSGRFDEASALYRQEALRSPRDPEVRLELINLFTDRKMDGPAAALIQDFIAKFPEDPRGYDLLAFVDDRRGRRFDAIDPLRRYVSRHPENDRLARILAGLLMASAQQGRP
jgi:tetratricopeptide (TPR) repeat protein